MGKKNHEIFMLRCFDLARFGAAAVSPNPMVGAVIVNEGSIIGEGWHQAYGQAHAEVNAIASIKAENRKQLPFSTLYVSLEPCCIYGKTPPCTDLILDHGLSEVVISCLDQTPTVAGKGVEMLRRKGVNVTTGILQQKGEALARIRNTLVTKSRPYIILKFAQSADGYLGKRGESYWLTNAFSKTLVHKWRSETDAILVGTTTAAIDNPRLNNRYFTGPDPLRIVLDRTGRLARGLHIFDDSQDTWIISERKDAAFTGQRTLLKTLCFDENMLTSLLEMLFRAGKSSILVEGGAHLLNSFIVAGLWDEARIFTSPKLLGNGIEAPRIRYLNSAQYQIGSDTLTHIFNYS